MLEAIREHAQGKIAKIILALITVPFALWGIDSYLKQGGEGPVVAKVAGQKIYRQEFDQALKDQQERLRGALGKGFDPALMDTPAMRMSVLERLIDQRVLLAEARREGLVVTDAQLAKYIGGIEAFQEGGKFSQARYETLLRQQQMNPLLFEQRLRQDLLLQVAQEGVARSDVLPKTVLDDLIRTNEQEREISLATFSTDQFLSQAKPGEPAVKAYYDKHPEEFKVPEQVRLEYVVLSAASLASQITVSEDEIARYYKDHEREYGVPEERRASHILISVAPNATVAEKKAAGDKARKVWEEAKRSPADFGKLAKEYSQDPGSAAQGGDLGFFARGAMVKAFEDAVFKMSDGQISEPVQSEFGFHIIKLTGIKGGKTRSLDEMRNQIAEELKKQKASKKFAELAENFSNLVYEQGDSLKPAAQQLGLKIEESGWVSRAGSGNPMLSNAKLLQAVFSEDVLKNKRNTEAIEVAPNTLLAARLLEYKPVGTKSLAEVSATLAERMQRQEASSLAVKAGKEALAALRQGKEPAGLHWGQGQVLSLSKPGAVEGQVLREAFKVGTDHLPAYGGAENPQGGGYTLVKVLRVMEGKAVDEKTRKAYGERFAGLLEKEYAAAYLASLKQVAKIEIKEKNLGKADQ